MVERHCLSSYNPSIALILLEKYHTYIVYICLIHQIPNSCIDWTSSWKHAKDVTALQQLTIFFLFAEDKNKKKMSVFVPVNVNTMGVDGHNVTAHQYEKHQI